MEKVRNFYLSLIAPLRTLALREGSAVNEDMAMTRLVQRVLFVGPYAPQEDN